MQFKISNETGSRLDVSWGKVIGVRQAHQGFLAPHDEIEAAPNDLSPLMPGEKVWVRGIADDGRIVATTLVVDHGRDNVAHLSAKSITLTEELTLPEEVLELALDDNGRLKGVTREHLEMALFTGALYELQYRGRLLITEDSVQIKSRVPTGDRTLDRALQDLGDKDRVEDLGEVIFQLALVPGAYYELVVQGLVARGILHAEESRLMWLIPSWALRPANTVPESHLVHKLLKVLALGLPGDDRTDQLITILSCCFDSRKFIEEELLSDVEQRLYDVAQKAAPPLAAVRNAVSEAMSRKAMVYAAYPGVPPGSL